MFYFLLITIIVALLGVLGWLIDRQAKLQAENDRFASFKDADEHSKHAEAQAKRAAEGAKRAERMQEALQRQKATLESDVARLTKDLDEVVERGELQDFGYYTFRYDFSTSKAYEAKLRAIRDRLKKLLKEDQATVAPLNWTIDGSEAKGRKMIRERSKMMLRAFNGESDAAIARVKYNNVLAQEKRMRSSFLAINKLASSHHITIAENYLDTKLDELFLVHELHEKRQAEKEEAAELKELMRQELAETRELERAQAKAEKDEARWQAALEKAQQKVDAATGDKLLALQQQISKMKAEIEQAQANQKAISQAQLTKAGHVYVISNVGSFGPDVIKIGMTRRLEPMERIRELGSASVPFKFDVHGFIRSENAPDLERRLHDLFSHRRLNKVNLRREFFRVNLDEVQAELDKAGVHVELNHYVEAEEFRKSQAMDKSRAA